MKASVIATILPLLLIPAVAGAQRSACGEQATKFEVKTVPAVPPPGVDAEKAVVFIIERDLTTRTFTTPSTRVGMDGEWLGATSGDSYSFFSVAPGVHHLCADTKFGGIGGGGQAFLHFKAEAGATYFFEIRNTRVGDPKWSDELHDVSLQRLDEDEGQYLVSLSAFVSSQRKN